MRRSRRMIAPLCALVVLAGACGSDNKSSSPATTAGGGTATTAGQAPETTGQAPQTTGGAATTTAQAPQTTAAVDLNLPKSCDATQGVTDDKITITVLSDLSGPIAAAGGVDHAKAFKAHFDAINDAGGIDGRKVEVDVRDMKYDPTVAAGEYEKVRTSTAMVADILGSGAINAIAGDMEKDCLITFQGATNGVLAQTYTSVFSPSTSAGHDVVSGVAYALEQKKDATFAVAYQADPYGEALKAAGDFAAKESGFSWKAEVNFGARDTDMTAQTQQLLAADPDYVVYGGLPTQLAGIVAGVHAAGNDMKFLIPTGAWSPVLLTTPAADAIVDSVIVITPFAAWGGTEKGVVQMREEIAKYAADTTPGSAVQTGYNAATIAAEVLRVASSNGDLSLGGIYRAAATLKFDNQGLVPPLAYGSRADEPRIPSVATRIWKPSKTAEGSVEPLSSGVFDSALGDGYVEPKAG